MKSEISNWRQKCLFFSDICMYNQMEAVWTWVHFFRMFGPMCMNFGKNREKYKNKKYRGRWCRLFNFCLEFVRPISLFRHAYMAIWFSIWDAPQSSFSLSPLFFFMLLFLLLPLRVEYYSECGDCFDCDTLSMLSLHIHIRSIAQFWTMLFKARTMLVFQSAYLV